MLSLSKWVGESLNDRNSSVSTGPTHTLTLSLLGRGDWNETPSTALISSYTLRSSFATITWSTAVSTEFGGMSVPRVTVRENV